MSVWGNFHPGWNINARYYFNPYTLKLDPFLQDQANFSYNNKEVSNWDSVSGGLINPPFNPADKSKKYLKSSIEALRKSSLKYSDKALFRSDRPININIAEENYQNKALHISSDSLTELQNYGSSMKCSDNFPNATRSIPSNLQLVTSRITGGELKVWRLTCAPIKLQKISGCGSTMNINQRLTKEISIHDPEVFNIEKMADCDSLKIRYLAFNSKKYSTTPIKFEHVNTENPLLTEIKSGFIKNQPK